MEVHGTGSATNRTISFHPSGWAARDFLLEGVALVSIGHKESHVPRVEEYDRKDESEEPGVGSDVTEERRLWIQLACFHPLILTLPAQFS